MKKAINQVHTCLLNNHSIYEFIENEINKLESKRGNIHESKRKELETNIGRKKDLLKFIKKQELELRELFNYLDYN